MPLYRRLMDQRRLGNLLFLWPIAIGLLWVSGPFLNAEEPPSLQEEAVAEIRLRGGKVTVDENDPIHPIIGVDMDDFHNVGAKLRFVDGFKQLKQLSLSHTDLTDADLNRICRFTQLEKLHIGGTAITNSGLKCLHRLPKLKLLSLAESININSDGVKNLAGMQSLTHLKLSYTNVDDPALRHIAKGLPQIEVLWLSDTRITNSGLQNLETLPRLRVLNFSHITNVGLEHLSKISTLERLGMEGSELTDTDLIHFERLCRLRELTINPAPKITNAGLKHFAPLTKLTKLEIYNCQATDQGLENLFGLSQLKRLAVGKNVTAAGIERLHQALPNCKVSAL
ncbi:MAG: hypothetical protein ABFC77_13070 [Thermoguttaceae bacterium]